MAPLPLTRSHPGPFLVKTLLLFDCEERLEIPLGYSRCAARFTRASGFREPVEQASGFCEPAPQSHYRSQSTGMFFEKKSSDTLRS